MSLRIVCTIVVYSNVVIGLVVFRHAGYFVQKFTCILVVLCHFELFPGRLML